MEPVLYSKSHDQHHIYLTEITTTIDEEGEEGPERLTTREKYAVFAPQAIDQSASAVLAQYDVVISVR